MFGNKKRRVHLGRTLLINNELERSRFVVKHPFWGFIIYGIIAYVILFTSGTLAGGVDSFLNGSSSWLASGISYVFYTLFAIIAVKGIFILSKDMYFGKNVVASFLMAIPFLAVLFLLIYITKDQALSDEELGSALFAGSVEEFVFRFIPVVCYKRPGVKKTSDLNIALISSAVFLAYHIPNILIAGNESILKTLVSFPYIAFIGFYLTAVYIRSGSILMCMILHTINNITAIKLTTPSVTGMDIIFIGVGFVLASFAYAVLTRTIFMEKFKKKYDLVVSKINKVFSFMNKRKAKTIKHNPKYYKKTR